MKKRIYYYDTDCGGVVYYANYLKYLEEARTEFFEARGVFVKDLWASGIGFVVARQEIDYKFPSFYGDILEIKTTISQLGAAKIVFEHITLNQVSQLINKAKTVLVCVDEQLKPKPIPDDIRNKIV